MFGGIRHPFSGIRRPQFRDFRMIYKRQANELKNISILCLNFYLFQESNCTPRGYHQLFSGGVTTSPFTLSSLE